MIKRTNEIKVRLTDKELVEINKRAKASFYDREHYIRSVINGHVPQIHPPPEYYAMMNGLRRIGVNLCQIASKAKVMGVADSLRYVESYDLFLTKLLQIVHFICLPGKTEYLPIKEKTKTKTPYLERNINMLKRTNAIKIRLTDKELERLNKRAKESGYAREHYIRALIEGNIPRPMPPLDYHAMMREFHAIGKNLNQIAHKAHVLGVIDAVRYDAAVHKFIIALNKIEEWMLLPEKIKKEM
jgi:predicted DNA binding CopG/RHH family protein